MRSSMAGALVWRMMQVKTPNRMVTHREGSRRLKNLKVLVELRCAGPKAHELAYVYKLPGDVMPRIHEDDHLTFLHGELLFVSTDDEHFGPDGLPSGVATLSQDLATEKTKTRALNQEMEQAGMRLRLPTGRRRWQPVVDVLDYKLREDDEHPSLVMRCRCGTRPPADRAEVAALAEAAQKDGKTRRLFL